MDLLNFLEFDLPLHPLIVHFPIALAIFLPILSITIFILFRNTVMYKKAWILVVLFSGIYAVTALIAEETGESEETKVERYVGESAMEKHEELGERIPKVSWVLFVLSIIPLITNKTILSQSIFIAASIAGVYPIYQAGHSGAELVYKYGAANAHAKKLLEYKRDNGGKIYFKNREDLERKTGD